MAGGRGVCVGLLAVLSVAGVALAGVARGDPHMGSCPSSSACGPLACCRITPQRYSVPQCMPLGGVGDWCRLNDEPRDVELGYPNNQRIFVEDLYTLMCPCKPDLVCSPVSSTCQLPSNVFSESENSLE